jgi:hypothetical protein
MYCSVVAAPIAPVISIILWKTNHQSDRENSKIVENPVNVCCPRANCHPLIPVSALSSDIYQAEVRAAATIANVRIVDMSDAICGRERCEMQEGDLVIDRDGDHLTSS